MGTFTVIDKNILNLEEGLVRAIGVSNYNVNHLEELLEQAEIMPAVNLIYYNYIFNSKGESVRVSSALVPTGTD